MSEPTTAERVATLVLLEEFYAAPSRTPAEFHELADAVGRIAVSRLEAEKAEAIALLDEAALSVTNASFGVRYRRFKRTLTKEAHIHAFEGPDRICACGVEQ